MKYARTTRFYSTRDKSEKGRGASPSGSYDTQNRKKIGEGDPADPEGERGKAKLPSFWLNS